MKAIGYTTSSTGAPAESLRDLDIEKPRALARDLLIEIKAISVNPRDIKVRRSEAASDQAPRVLGWDAAGIVREVGPDVQHYKVGDEVFYAGDMRRAGTYAQYHLVDERIVGLKPVSLDWEAAAALPLTGLTAYEMLFDRLGLTQGAEQHRNVFILGGAGGVPSMAIQLARQLTGATVVATASRPESRQWVLDMGAHHVIDHTQDLAPQFSALGVGQANFVFTTHTDANVWRNLAKLMAPQGRLGLIDDPEPLDLRVMKAKSVSIHWESMFTRSAFETDDMGRQREILNHIAALADKQVLRSTLGERYGLICAANIIRAHKAIEGGRVRGKITLTGFPD